MGRIRTQLTKSVSAKLVKEHAKDFKKDFDENKKVVDRYAQMQSKKMRNVVAGYITRLMKTQEKL